MPEFFESGVQYVEDEPYRAPELLAVFSCEYVAEHPATGEPLAFGFVAASYPGNLWQPVVLATEQWSRGWVARPAAT